MNEVWIALISVVGTLAAVILTARMQHIASERTSSRADRRRLVDQRADVLSEFSGHVIDYRRAELHRWHEVAAARRERKELDPDDAHSANEARSTRSAAWGSYYRLRLLWDDESITGRAEGLLHRTSGLEHAASSSDVKNEADGIREELGKLVDDARLRLTASPSA